MQAGGLAIFNREVVRDNIKNIVRESQVSTPVHDAAAAGSPSAPDLVLTVQHDESLQSLSISPEKRPAARDTYVSTA